MAAASGTLTASTELRDEHSRTSEMELNFQRVLELFHCAVTEEQAWAICYQCAKAVKTNWATNREGCFRFNRPELVVLCRTGDISFIKPTDNTGPVKSKLSLINSLGRLIYEALDYGNDEEAEVELSEPFESLIRRMTIQTGGAGGGDGIDDEDDDNQHSDEGIDDEVSSESADEHEFILNGWGLHPEDLKGSVDTFSKVMRLCSAHLSQPSEAAKHFQGIVSAVATQALELVAFIDKVTTSKKSNRHKFDEHEDERFTILDLDTAEWARLFMKVIQELREGVVLRKVQQRELAPVEYQLTPYEMLMDEVRSKRFNLIDIATNVAKRKLKPKPPRIKTDREQMMDQIHTTPKLNHIKHVPNYNRGLKLGRVVETPGDDKRPPKFAQNRLKLLPSIDLGASLDDVSTDDEFSSSQELSSDDDTELFVDEHHFDETDNSIIDLLQQLPEPSSWKQTPFPAPHVKSTISRRHSVSLCESPHKRLVAEHRGLSVEQDHFSVDDLILERNATECLSLTVEEVMHIRGVLTNADLDNMQLSKQLYDDVKSEKVCFNCRTTKFRFYNKSFRCRLCMKRICRNCCRKIQIPAEHYLRVPVACLSPVSSPEQSPFKSKYREHSVSAPPTPHVSPEKTLYTPKSYPQWEQRINGSTIVICKECKTFIRQVIKSTRHVHQHLKISRRLQNRATPTQLGLSLIHEHSTPDFS